MRFAEHGTTLHGGNFYVDPTDRMIHPNTAEGAFSIFKRDLRGVYQHCGENSTCTATLPSSSSATITVPPTALMTLVARLKRLSVSSESC